MADFSLHPILQKDCHILGQVGDCHVLLHRNALLDWFIVVPQTDVQDFLDLPESQRQQALGLCEQLATCLKQNLSWERVNFGAIGHLVPQLHLHVVGRREGDAAWPAPVWGNLPAGPERSEQALADVMAVLKTAKVL